MCKAHFLGSQRQTQLVPHTPLSAAKMPAILSTQAMPDLPQGPPMLTLDSVCVSGGCILKQTAAFSLPGVRCAGRDEHVICDSEEGAENQSR